jgi:hypothetical protein
VSSSAIGSVLESVLGSVLESFLRAGGGVCNKQARCVPLSTSERVLGSMPGSVLENVLGVYLGASCELT